ncbi:hypothetical protein P8452_20192 [Trifolium repens]|nr:hypothetical protein P8452_20192 [Trifolium repens]
MTNIITTQVSLLLLLLLSLITFHRSVSTTNDHKLVPCNDKDQETLLIFKKGINDSSNGKISTWSTKKDCCAWEGVHCDNITGRVTELDLRGQGLTGEMNLSILKLEFLSYLDLSVNGFDVINIPSTLHNITHKSNLFYLDLTPLFTKTLHMDNLDWLSPFSSLKYLNLSGIDLRKTNWLQSINKLSSLLELHLSHCNLHNIIINPSIEYLNLSSLVALDLYKNNITSNIPNNFFNLTKDLTYLNLQENNIHGEIPSSLLNLQNLRFLDLSQNQLQGSIPDGIGQLENIQNLDLYGNMLSGSINPLTVGNLSSLYDLAIGKNNFSGEISENTFSKLSNLDSLDLTSSNFVFQFDLDWVPPFQLSMLFMDNTNVGSNFPSWIYTQKSLLSLFLSSSGISLVDRNNFSSLIESISYSLYLSNNSMTGDISNLTLKCRNLMLDHNNFTGGLPHMSPMAYVIDLSYNSFSGSIPHSWKYLKNLMHINLWSNKLSGVVHLSNWTQLEVLILGGNEFSGTIPFKMSQNLQVVILRANQFGGTIPTQLFNLPYLFHLDLAHNKLSGSMPNCNYNLTQMITFHKQIVFFTTTIELFTKGQDYLYAANPYRRTMDLSANNLKWRHACYRFVDRVGDKLYVTLMVIMHVADPEMLCRL